MPRRYSMKQRAEPSAATRARVLDAVLALILEHGPDAVTVQAVAARADVAPRTIYNHFPSRDALLAAAWADLASEVAAVALQDIDAAASSAREKLRSFVRGTYTELQAHSPRLGAILAVRGYPELDEAVARARAQRQERLRDILRPAAASGELRLPLDEAVALAYVLTAHATWEMLVDQLPMSTPEAINLATHCLDVGLFRSADLPDNSSSPPLDQAAARQAGGPTRAPRSATRGAGSGRNGRPGRSGRQPSPDGRTERGVREGTARG